MTISIPVILDVGNWLQGTCNTLDAAIEHFDLEVEADELEDRLLDINIEMCRGCYWWHESTELVDPDDDENEDLIGFCEDCRNERK